MKVVLTFEQLIKVPVLAGDYMIFPHSELPLGFQGLIKLHTDLPAWSELYDTTHEGITFWRLFPSEIKDDRLNSLINPKYEH